MLVGYRKTWPPPILRMSYAMNFPALTASYSLQFARWAASAVVRYNRPPFLFLTLQDCMFLLSVGVLWYWLGAKLDASLGRRITTQRSRQITINSLAIGCVVSVRRAPSC